MRTLTFAAVAGIIALCLAASSGSSASTEHVRVCDISGCAKSHPRVLRFHEGASGLLWLVGIHRWHGWGSPEAWGQGWLRTNTCEPNCAEGRYRNYHAVVSLSRIHRCRGRRVYSEVDVSPAQLRPTLSRVNCSGVVVGLEVGE